MARLVAQAREATFAAQGALPREGTEIAAALLSWTQGFEYERDREGSDFLNLADAFAGSAATATAARSFWC
jgi:hypothetical protein